MKIVFEAFLAQAVTPAATSSSLLNDPAVLLYVTAGFLFLLAILVVIVATYVLQVINILTRKEAEARAQRLGIVFKPEPSWWSRLMEMLNASVPVEKEVTIIMDHNYDGIKELDNHLPPWWKWLFYATIVFAGVYLFMYHVTSSLPLSIPEYENELSAAQTELLKQKAANPGPKIDESNVEATTDSKALADGKTTFVSICASCHRPDGGGDIGPNLTDKYWKHGGDIADIFKTVKNGVPNTNMVAWGNTMSPEKIRNVSSYVLTLQGSNPANGKKPEGELYTPKPKELKKDTTKTQASL